LFILRYYLFFRFITGYLLAESPLSSYYIAAFEFIFFSFRQRFAFGFIDYISLTIYFSRRFRPHLPILLILLFIISLPPAIFHVLPRILSPELPCRFSRGAPRYFSTILMLLPDIDSCRALPPDIDDIFCDADILRVCPLFA